MNTMRGRADRLLPDAASIPPTSLLLLIGCVLVAVIVIVAVITMTAVFARQPARRRAAYQVLDRLMPSSIHIARWLRIAWRDDPPPASGQLGAPPDVPSGPPDVPSSVAPLTDPERPHE